jgi:hypothetical protein
MADDPKTTVDEELDELEGIDDDLDDDDLGEDEGRSMALDPDSILDSLVPSSIDWKGTVGRHPMVSVAAVSLVGFLVGRTKGAAIMAGLSAGLSSAMARQLADVFEGDFFDF